MSWFRLRNYGLYFNADAGGNGGGSGTDNGSGQNAGGGAGSQDNPPAFTPEQQKVIDRLLGERAQRADDAATKRLLETFGVKDADELKAKMLKAKELEDAQLTELQKAQKLAADEKARADAAEQAKADALVKANETLTRAAVLAEAVKQNFRDEDLNDVWLKVDHSKVTVKDDGTVEGVADAVKAVAKDKPHWLKPDAKRSNGTPASGVRGNGNGKDQPQPIKVSL